MAIVRIFGILVSLGGMVFFLYSLFSGYTNEQVPVLNYAIFAMVGGLLVAMAADAGQKLANRAKNPPKAKGGEKK